MRIAAMAAGAVGGYFGARLAAAGHDVFFIARGAHRDAIVKNGLKIESVQGDLHLPKPNVTDDPAKVGPVDIVLFAVKLWDTETAAATARPLLGPDSRLITFQNGVDSVDRLSAVLGADRVIGGAAYIATVIASPGVIKHSSAFAMMRFGRADKKPDNTLNSFVDAGKAAKLDIAGEESLGEQDGGRGLRICFDNPPWVEAPAGDGRRNQPVIAARLRV
jgi:2-dehydropantoate 2-reductase